MYVIYLPIKKKLYSINNRLLEDPPVADLYSIAKMWHSSQADHKKEPWNLPQKRSKQAFSSGLHV